MGLDPILTETPIAVPVVLIIALIALTATALPILFGEQATHRRRRHAVWGSWACLAAVVLAMATELAPGLYGFITLAAIAGVAGMTLLRSRHSPA